MRARTLFSVAPANADWPSPSTTTICWGSAGWRLAVNDSVALPALRVSTLGPDRVEKAQSVMSASPFASVVIVGETVPPPVSDRRTAVAVRGFPNASLTRMCGLVVSASATRAENVVGDDEV